MFVGTVMRGPKPEASERAQVVEQILDRELPGWSRVRPGKDKSFSWLRDQASRAKPWWSDKQSSHRSFGTTHRIWRKPTSTRGSGRTVARTGSRDTATRL